MMRHWYYRVAKGQGMRAEVSDERGAGKGERKKEKSVVFTTDVRDCIIEGINNENIKLAARAANFQSVGTLANYLDSIIDINRQKYIAAKPTPGTSKVNQEMLIFLGLRTDTAAGWPNVMNLQTRNTFLIRHWYYRVAKGQGMRAVVSVERGAEKGERKKEKSVVFTTDVRGIFGQNILERKIEYIIIDPGV
ncbi:unnamed protein product [Acanthoscelides obtectus]|uniref:Uncharacterized protein n=1 Tax=Acanthoscelides obtectus TaxID=200917 RepID=A0A9P0M6H5_ACAOB|nr:unnamed protein product [Acanthoscelides obtectus]CAK1652239.1 hypothetical protein AOBTE_LOCUS17747 [Acanthoscelides obtectus]